MRLAAVLDWATEHDADMNELEREFVASGRSFAERQAADAARTNRRLRAFASGVAGLLAVSLIVGSLAIAQRNDARAAAAVADAQQLAARSQDESELSRSLLLAREAVALHDAPETRSALFASLQRDPFAVATMYGSQDLARGDASQWMRLSPDGRVLAVGSSGRVVQLFDTTTQGPTWAYRTDGSTLGGAFSPDGTTLGLITSLAGVVLVDVTTQQTRLRAPRLFPDPVAALAFLPDGTGVLTLEYDDDGASLVERDASSLEPLHAALDVGRADAMALSRDGRELLVTNAKTTWMLTLGDARLSDRFPVGGDGVALSADGRQAAFFRNRGVGSSSQADVSFLDLRSGQSRTIKGAYRGSGEDEGVANGIAFTPDGRSAITTGNNGRILIWDVASRTIRDTLSANGDLAVFGPAVSPDGSTLFTTDLTGGVLVTNLTGDAGVMRPFVAGGGFASFPYFAISPDGRTLATMTSDFRSGMVSLIDTSTLKPMRRIRYPHSWPNLPAFSPDGTTLAVTSFNSSINTGAVGLWRVRNGHSYGPVFEGLPTGAQPVGVAWSHDGRTLAVSTYEGNAGGMYVWDARAGGSPRAEVAYPDRISQLSFAPNGSLVASAGTARLGSELGTLGHVLFLDPTDLTVESTIRVNDGYVYWSDVSSDGRILATASSSGAITLWDLTTGGIRRQVLSGLSDPAYTVDISPDGREIIAASDTGEVVMWDTATGTAIGDPFPGSSDGDTAAAAFTPDGSNVVVVSENGLGQVWDVDQTSWERRACNIAARNLTPGEWHFYLPDRPYATICAP